MRIRSGRDLPSPTRRDAAGLAEQPASRSLVPLQAIPARSQTLTRYPRPSSAFLAHLIAVAQHIPQTRARCQAEPAAAAALYAAAPAAQPGDVRYIATV